MFYPYWHQMKHQKGRGWQYHFKCIEQNWYSYLLSVHWTYRCQVTVIASWQAYQATSVSWHLFVCCILRKDIKQSCPLYLIWHFQRPPYQKQHSKATGSEFIINNKCSQENYTPVKTTLSWIISVHTSKIHIWFYLN